MQGDPVLSTPPRSTDRVGCRHSAMTDDFRAGGGDRRPARRGRPPSVGPRVALCAWVLATAGCVSRPAPTTSAVQIRAFQFAPTADTVQTGDTVVWTNADVVPHTATTLEKTFDSGTIEAGGTWRHVASTPGTYQYECALHPTMRGTLVVR